MKTKNELIEDALREAKYFSKDLKKYLFELERQKDLTREEIDFVNASRNIHRHTEDALLLLDSISKDASIEKNNLKKEIAELKNGSNRLGEIKKVGVIKRNDYIFWTNRMSEIIYFCAECDPKGEGGHGGVLARNVGIVECCNDLKQFFKFCPTCGKPVDWTDVTEIKNQIK